jgi:tRNA pseudouridine38-40 synthase
MRYLKLTIAYDGTDYCGWQVQKNRVSIQQRLEESWEKVTGESIRIVASGRTDGGVHAEGQVCSLATLSTFTPTVLLRALNAETPFDISVLEIEEAAAGFHAIRDAVAKTYRYQIQFGRIRDPLKRRYWWHVPRELDLSAIRQGASYLLGTHDFASFQSAGAERDSTIRTVSRLDVIEGDPRTGQPDLGSRQPASGLTALPFLHITITADGFLYKMVRNIVGSLVRVGEGREPPQWMEHILQQRNRQAAGMAAPPQGLFLQEVVY